MTPFFGTDGSEPDIPCCSKTDYKPDEKKLQKYLEIINS
jgi:hypothetical protein